jgi:hypothetical protein
VQVYQKLSSSVSIAIGLRAAASGVRIPVAIRKIFSSKKVPGPLWSPPSLLFNIYGGIFSGLKQSGRAADHSPSSSTEVKNGWSYTFTPPIGVNGMDTDKITSFSASFTPFMGLFDAACCIDSLYNPITSSL